MGNIFLLNTVYADIHFHWCGELRNLTEVAKNWKRDTLRGFIQDQV